MTWKKWKYHELVIFERSMNQSATDSIKIKVATRPNSFTDWPTATFKIIMQFHECLLDHSTMFNKSGRPFNTELAVRMKLLMAVCALGTPLVAIAWFPFLPFIHMGDIVDVASTVIIGIIPFFHQYCDNSSRVKFLYSMGTRRWSNVGWRW